MSYKKAIRVVTVEFGPETDDGAFQIRTTPERVVVRYGDSIIWDVQGLSPAEAKKVGFGNFLTVEQSPWFAIGKKGLRQVKGKDLHGKKVRVKDQPHLAAIAPDRALAQMDLDEVEPGVYKYDILYDGQVLIDPDIEIRGPKR
jgi:hypothetical protein